MFKCCNCKKSATQMERVVVETRPKIYYTTILRHRRTYKQIVVAKLLTQEEKDQYKILKYQAVRTVTAKGSEIVREIQSCKECANKLNQEDVKNV